MKTALQESIIENEKSIKESEVGFTLCADRKNNLLARNICKGEECEIIEKCPTYESFEGIYRTRPTSLSGRDLIRCGTTHITCIGGRKDNKLRCHTWQHEPISKETYSELKKLDDCGAKKIYDPVHEKNFECIKEMRNFSSTEYLAYTQESIFKGRIQKLKERNAPLKEIKETENKLKSIKEDTIKNISREHKEIVESIPKYYKEKINMQLL